MPGCIAKLFVTGLARARIVGSCMAREDILNYHEYIALDAFEYVYPVIEAVGKLDWTMPRDHLLEAIAAIVHEKDASFYWEMDDIQDHRDAKEFVRSEEYAAYKEVMKAAEKISQHNHVLP